jgi:hypothetical protein
MSEVQKDQKTDEEIVQGYLQEGREDLSALSDQQLDLYLNMAREYEPTEQEQPTQIEEPTEGQEQPIPAIEDSIPEFDKHKEYRDTLARANRFEQLYKDRESKIEKMKEDPEFAKKQLGFQEEVKVDENKDYLDDKYLATLEREISDLKEWKTTYEAEHQRTQKEIEAEKQQLSMFSEIQKLQGEYSGLKTSESFQSIDSKVTDWKGGLISAGLDPNKYLTDKEYKATLDAKGYKLNVKEADIPKLMNVYKVYSNYLKEQDAGYNTSIERSFRTSEVFEEVLKSQYGTHQQADDDAINAAIEQRAKEPSILNTGSAPASSEGMMDLIKEQGVLIDKTQRTDSDNRRLDELDRLLAQYF